MNVSILNLGAGVQSTTIYVMACANRRSHVKGFPLMYPEVGLIDFAIFADTQDEPEEVYKHLDWLERIGGPPILRRTKGRLSESLKYGVASWGTPILHPHHRHRFASIPAFTAATEGTKDGRVPRQCTKEYKLEVIDRAIRRDILHRNPRQRILKGTKVRQIIGISQDEAGRATRLYERIVEKKIHWLELDFPLLSMRMSREHCIEFLKPRVPHETPRSACVFCPFHDDAEWLRIQANPRDWALAVAVDESLRQPGNVVNRNLDQKLYLHRSCKPLVQISFDPKPSPKKQQKFLNFSNECLGMCGV